MRRITFKSKPKHKPTHTQNDALTALEHHGLAVPERVDAGLKAQVEAEATRRMTALVAPAAGAVSREEVLRLSMGRLFEQARAQAPACKCFLFFPAPGVFVNGRCVAAQQEKWFTHQFGVRADRGAHGGGGRAGGGRRPGHAGGAAAAAGAVQRPRHDHHAAAGHAGRRPVPLARLRLQPGTFSIVKVHVYVTAQLLSTWC